MISRIATQMLQHQKPNRIFQRNSSMKPKVFQEKGECHVYESARDVLPFNPLQNTWVRAAKVTVYVTAVFAFPFWYINHSMKKAASS